MIKFLLRKKTVIESALAELKTAHASKDLAKITSSLEALNTAWSAASEDMYKAQQPNADGAPNADQNAGAEQKQTSW